MRRFVESADTLLDILEGQPEPREPVVSAMLALRQAYNGDAGERLGAIRQAGDAQLDGVEPDLAVLFLSVWAEVSSRLRRVDETEALLRRIRPLMGARTRPEIEAYVLLADAHAFALRGKKTEAESSLRRAMKILPAGAPRRAIYLLVFARFLAHAGRETEVDGKLSEESRNVPADYAAEVPYVRFVQMVETCRLREARELAPHVNLESEILVVYRTTFGRYAKLMEFLLDAVEDNDTREARSAGDASDEAVLLALLDRNPREALRLARLQEEEEPGAYVTAANFLAFDLLRAELACGNAGAARRIMAMRRELGNLHYLDHLFAARIDALDGDFRSAARHFAMVRNLCARYRAEARLDLELRMACEMPPDVAMRLALAAAESERAREGPLSWPAPVASTPRLIGRSPAMEALREAIGRMAPLDAPVLITGETGVGKDLVARTLHEQSPRREHPFIAVNCGAIAETLLESELFGHARGAFTGAERERRGIFEEAGAGTVFLDEIGEMPLRLQVALLRVLESGEIRPVGSSRPRPARCRIVAATNADLAGMVRERRFRQDLFYRLHRLDIAVPSLRARDRKSVV